MPVSEDVARTRRERYLRVLELVKSGLSVIPIQTDGSKAPALRRGDPVLLRKRKAIDRELISWFRDDDNGIGVLGGAISGGLECLDFEDGHSAARWKELAGSQVIGLDDLACWVSTPSGGWHLWYRCETVEGNQKLARTEDGETLIETRGEGGYAVLPGSPKECHPSGKEWKHAPGSRLLTNLATITPEQRSIFLNVARSLNQLADSPKESELPGDDFNRRGPDWESILKPAGWKCIREDKGIRYWQRPGKDGKGHSATTGACRAADGTDLFFPFSSNSHPFEAGKGYSKFRTYATLYHTGDLSKAAADLARQGYGSGAKPKPKPEPVKADEPLIVQAEKTAKSAAPQPVIIRLSQVKKRPIEWLWGGWIPRGKLTVLDGDPGLGKSTMLCDLAARLTRGWAMPDDTPPATDGGVVLLSAEDDPEDTVRPRLEAAGADLERIINVEFVSRPGSPFAEPLTIPDHLDCLEAAIEQVQACLVVFDPITSYFGKGIDYSKDTDVRRALRPLKELASRKKCAIVYLRHLNKGGGGKSLYRGGGSIAFVGAARSGLLVARDPNNDKGSVLAWVKGNIAERPTSLRFSLVGTGESGIAAVEWNGECPLTADELLEAVSTDSETKMSRQEAIDFLDSYLRNGPRSKAEILIEAKKQGISKSTLDRARQQLGVIAKKIPSYDGTFKGNTWQLPNWTNTKEDEHEDR